MTTIGLVTVTALTGLGGLGYLIVTIGVQRGSFGFDPDAHRGRAVRSAWRSWRTWGSKRWSAG